MKVKLSHILLVAYLILASLITKKIQIIPLALFAAAFFAVNFLWKGKISSGLEHLAYVIIAFIPFPFFLYLFLIHLPFAVFGLLLEKRAFLKSYILGFAVSLLSTVIIYTASNYLGLKLNFIIILLIFYLPAVLAFAAALRKKKASEAFNLGLNEYSIILLALLATAFVGMNIATNDSLFISNGTYLYTKFELIVKSIQDYSTFPLYDPATSQGESPFLFESPLVFSHLAFVSIMLPLIQPVAFYNAFSLFTVLLAVLSLSLLLRSALGLYEDKDSLFSAFVISLGSILIGLNFYFMQLLESYKQFFAFPINYLILSMILDRPKTFREVSLICCMIALTFIIHTPHGVGIILISFSLFLLIMLNIYFSGQMNEVGKWIVLHKAKILALAMLLFLFSLFYIMPPFIFKDFLEDKPDVVWMNFITKPKNYFRDFIYDSPFSLKYPDIARNDDKKAGPFISVFGFASLLAVLVFFRKKAPSGLWLFSGAYALHFFLSSIIINHPAIGSLEYAFRTAQPYFIIVLGTFICALIIMIGNKNAKILLAVILIAATLHMLPYAKENIWNVHQESVISGKAFQNEVDFIKNLPADGRIMTYGLFANAVDPAMASLTGKYFSRFHLTQYARSRSVYSKIHSPHSFGQTDELLSMSGAELSNYLRLGGYKYVFLYLAHPVGNFAAMRLYPNFTYPVYQNNAIAILAVNGSNYAEKVNVLEVLNPDVYKGDGGYKYLALSRNYTYPKNARFSKTAKEPEHLAFKRTSPTEVEIFGNFDDNEWVTFKETYSLRWKAYISEKEAPVYASSADLVLVQAAKGDKIVLKYGILPVERVFGALSLIAALALLIWIVFLGTE